MKWEKTIRRVEVKNNEKNKLKNQSKEIRNKDKCELVIYNDYKISTSWEFSSLHEGTMNA